MSNKSSAIVQTLQRFQDPDALVYKLNLSLPNHSREIIYNSKSITNGNSQSVVFDVIKSGILKKMWLKVEIAYTVADKMATDHILNWMNSVSLMYNHQTLETLYPQTVRSFINKMPRNERECGNSALMSTGAVDNQTSYTCYLPLPFSFSKDPTRYLDTGFLGGLKLNLQLNAFTSVVPASNGVFSSATFSLYGEYVTLETEAYSKYRAAQFPAGKPLEFLWENSFAEPDADLAASTSHTMNLVCDRVITQTNIRVIQKAATNDAFSVKNVSRTVGLASIQLKGNGRVLYETDAFMHCSMNNAPVVSYAGLYAVTYDGNVCIDWTMLEAELEDAYAGGLSLKNIAGPQLVLTFTAANLATDDLQVMHKYLNFVQVDPNGGKMSVSSGI